nr:MAG TPA: hypothetical protein [Caudoviricetes sp.]
MAMTMGGVRRCSRNRVRHHRTDGYPWFSQRQ